MEKLELMQSEIMKLRFYTEAPFEVVLDDTAEAKPRVLKRGKAGAE